MEFFDFHDVHDSHVEFYEFHDFGDSQIEFKIFIIFMILNLNSKISMIFMILNWHSMILMIFVILLWISNNFHDFHNSLIKLYDIFRFSIMSNGILGFALFSSYNNGFIIFS